MKKGTVNDAIIDILKSEKRSLSAKEIYSNISEQNLYQFKSVTPIHIVLTQLRRHCFGLDFKSAHKQKYYQQMPDGKYKIKY